MRKSYRRHRAVPESTDAAGAQIFKSICKRTSCTPAEAERPEEPVRLPKQLNISVKEMTKAKQLYVLNWQPNLII